MLSSQPRPELYINYLRLGVLFPLALPQRSRASKVSYFFVFFFLASAIERFHSRGQQPFLDQKKTFTLEKSSTPRPTVAHKCTPNSRKSHRIQITHTEFK